MAPGTSSSLRVLALEPYYGGSHRAFLDTWQRHSRHSWTVLSLPAHHWKWRMRHSSVTLAAEAQRVAADGAAWDVVFCSDMLPLAEWKGLVSTASQGNAATRAAIEQLPAVAYFHENQLTYPARHQDQRDLHFAFSNISTAMAAEEVWFNSEFHLEDFYNAAEALLNRMPDYAPMTSVDHLRQKSMVQWPGGPEPVKRSPRKDGPMRIAWAARWEYDKGPETLRDTFRQLQSCGVAFQASVMGETFRETPPAFELLRESLEHATDCIQHWGFQARDAYQAALASCDVFVSTAEHEFFGLAVVEAMAAGAIVALPQRLSYPELLAPIADASRYFYDGTPEDLCRKLQDWDAQLRSSDCLTARAQLQAAAARFAWPGRAEAMDARLEVVAARGRPGQ